jgi:hypothetical protein
MIRTVFAAVALLLFTGAAQAQDTCDLPNSKLSPNQVQQCNAAHDATVKRQ